MGDLIDFSASMGLDSGKHACWGYEDEDAFWRDLTGFVEAGLNNGEQIVSVTPSGHPPTHLQQTRPAQWRTIAAEELFGDPAEAGAAAWGEKARHLVEEVLRDDVAGMRLITDATRTALHTHRRAIVEWELELDWLTSEYPLKVVCGLQSGVADKGTLTDMAAVHLTLRGSLPAPLASLHVHHDTLLLRGEFDLTSRSLLELALDREHEDHIVDLSHVEFMDLDSIEILRRYTRESAERGRPLHLSGVPDIVERCWQLLERDR